MAHDNPFPFRTANGSVLFYIAPAAIILATIVILGVPDKYWTPVLVVYGIGALIHALVFGFQAISNQLVDNTKYAVGELKDQQ